MADEVRYFIGDGDFRAPCANQRKPGEQANK